MEASLMSGIIVISLSPSKDSESNLRLVSILIKSPCLLTRVVSIRISPPIRPFILFVIRKTGSVLFLFSSVGPENSL